MIIWDPSYKHFYHFLTFPYVSCMHRLFVCPPISSLIIISMDWSQWFVPLHQPTKFPKAFKNLFNKNCWMFETIDCTEPKPFAAQSIEPEVGSAPPWCTTTKCGGPHRTKHKWPHSKLHHVDLHSLLVMAKRTGPPRPAPTRQKWGGAGWAELGRLAQYFSPPRLRVSWRIGGLARQKNKKYK